MGDPARRVATYEDVLDAPEHMIAQVVDSELHLLPRPGKAHAAAASVIGEELGPPFKRGRGGPGGWIILDEPELHLRADILVPDLAGWRRERMPALTVDEPYFTAPPDWVCEVLSPSTAQLDRGRKLPLYAACGVAFAWVVDPQARTLEVLRLVGERWLIAGVFSEDQQLRAEPFEAIVFELRLLWADVERPLAPTER